MISPRKHTPKEFIYQGGLDGVSENQISQHRDVIYVGYVSKLNEIEEHLRQVDRKAADAIYSDFREVKREEVSATNSIYLHEYYFGNLVRGEKQPTGRTKELLDRDFGSAEAWAEDFRAAGMASRGWVVLALNLEDGLLHNYLSDLHDTGGVWNAIVLLALDVYEQAILTATDASWTRTACRPRRESRRARAHRSRLRPRSRAVSVD